MAEIPTKSSFHWVICAVVIAIVLSVAAVFVVRSISGPQSPGFGNNPDAFPVVFQNDFGRTIELSACGNPPSCTTLYYTYKVSSGSSDTENIGTGVRSTWLITFKDSRRKRNCLTLDYPNYINSPKIPLTDAGIC